MDIISLQKYYSSIYYSLRRNGLGNKLLLAFLTIPAVIYAYFDINARYHYYEWDYPHEYLYYMCAALLAVMVVTVLSMDTISFVNSQRVQKLHRLFKKDLFVTIKEQIPEIKGYYYYQKIHPKYFKDSGLYPSTHTDYIGDDLFQGNYKGSRFEICELHVFNFFRPIFDGLFARIILNTSVAHSENTDKDLKTILDSFGNIDNVKVRIRNNTTIYLAVKNSARFFEENKISEIREIQDEIAVLSNIVRLIRDIIILYQPEP